MNQKEQNNEHLNAYLRARAEFDKKSVFKNFIVNKLLKRKNNDINESIDEEERRVSREHE